MNKRITADTASISLTYTCPKLKLKYTAVASYVWHDVSSCECCGTEVVTLADVTCPGCASMHTITIYTF